MLQPVRDLVDAPRSSAISAPARRPVVAAPAVAFVGDEGRSLTGAVEHIRSLGRRVGVWHDPEAAVQALGAEDGPSVAIVDERVAGVSGLDIVRSLRRRRRHRYLYLVLLVPRADPQAVLRARMAGADDGIAKPLALRELEVYLRAADRIIGLERRLRASRDEYRAQACRDALTGLSNRRSIIDALDKELDRSLRHGTPVSVLLVDLDHFKAINDRYGHLAGDEVLCEAARRMLSVLRGYDSLGRYGGEEFLAVLPGADEARAARIAERLRARLANEPVMTNDGSAVALSGSLGTATSHEAVSLDRGAMVHRADRAMYDAKAAGRNCVRTYRPLRQVPNLVADPALAGHQ